MGQGHEHWQVFGEEQIITRNVQRDVPSTITHLVQSLPKLYNLLSKREKFRNATVFVRQFFLTTKPLKGGGGTKKFSSRKVFFHPPPLFCLYLAGTYPENMTSGPWSSCGANTPNLPARSFVAFWGFFFTEPSVYTIRHPSFTGSVIKS